MFSWIILTGLLLGFMIGAFYLFCYWTINSFKPEPLIHNNGFRKVKKIAKIDRKTYEYAYRNNTNFCSGEANKVHQIKTLYENDNKAPNNKKKRMEGGSWRRRYEK